MAAIAADRNLLFGLLALQNGLINQVQIVAAFQAWTLDKVRDLADHLVSRGDLDADDRCAVDAPWHATSRSTAGTWRRVWPQSRRAVQPARAWLASTILMSAAPWPASARPRPSTATTTTARRVTPSARPPSMASGSASCGPTPEGGWARSSSPSTPSSTARWR